MRKRKLLPRAFAVLLASTIVLSNTSYSSFAANINAENANVSTTTSNESTNELSTEESSTDDSSNKLTTDDSTTASTDNTNAADIPIESDPNDVPSQESSTEPTTENETIPSDLSNFASNTTTNIDSTNEAKNFTWKSITFGQSTDLNFQSTILPEKIGTQYAEETQINVIDSSDENATPVTKDAIVMESRGGKIANAHDGLTFYYTTLPTSKNFVLEAKVFINQFGPENGSTPSKQEAVGLMVRDVIAGARQNPMIDGYEELPAASNIASTMVIAYEKKANTALNISSYQRNGVFYPYGNAHISYGATKFAQINTDGSKIVTEEVTPADGENYDSNQFFTLRLERKDDKFVTTYIDANGNEKSGSIDDPDRVAVIDEENMYVGFFASRNAKVTYTDIYLSTSDANTAPCSFVPESYALSFTNLSNTTTSSSDYTVAFRTNFDGTVEILKDGSVIESNGTVNAGEIFELPTTLTNDVTDFTINYTSSQGSKTESFTVTKNEAFNKDLYVSVDGTSSGLGTIESPLDLETAISYLSEGHTLYVRGGTYGPLDLVSTVSGSSKGMKTLAAYDDEEVIFSGNSYVKASYWNIRGISITGSNSAGLRASGNNNIFEHCTFYGNEDTGFQLGMGSDTDPLTWPENNIIRYCTSYQNEDASGINADGFAAKLGVGKNNLFDHCIAYQNADDGWDLFNKLGDAKNEPVTIQNCIAYQNGNNGFKLGGEGYAVNHVITDCLAFNNNLDGFTDNFNTGALTVKNCTSVDNKRYNYIFRLNPYATEGSETNVFTNNISFRSSYDESSVADYIYGKVINSYFFGSENDTITANDFISVTAPESYERYEDGTINFGDYMRPTDSSFLATGGVGTAHIGAISAKSPVTIISSITLDRTAATLVEGDTISLKASISPDNATNKKLNWTSSNTKVATVDQNGLVTALSKGTTTITVSSTDGSKISATCSITVEKKVIDVTSITLNKTSLVLAKGSKETLTATVSPQNATDTSVTFTSSNTKVATVDNAGKITGKAYGTAVITATSTSNPNISATCKVSVGYKITYKLNKGKNNEKNPSAYYNQNVTLKAPTRKGYEFKGWYTDSKFKTKITSIKKSSKKDITVYAKWEKVTKPSAPTIKSLSNIKGSKLKVTLKSSISGAKGYEITYATNKKFTKNKGTTTISKASTLNKTLSGLTKGNTYYVKVRAYKVDSAGNKVYGNYSKVLSVKIKK